jgi:amidase
LALIFSSESRGLICVVTVFDKAYLARIDEVNINGAGLRAVLETNPKAIAQAAELDLERKNNGSRGPLHGIPILVKDNIATSHSEGTPIFHSR